MKEVVVQQFEKLREKEKSLVDAVIGPRKKVSPHQTSNVDWRNCGLAHAYPDWDDFHIQLEEERVTAKREGRDPHPATNEPTRRNIVLGRERPAGPWADGPSAADVNKEYVTKHA